MSEELNNSKRIAKNTFILFLRMILVMGISLYTSRIILEALGVNDYGLYNVVAGFISILSYITASLSGTTSRYITFALGKQNKKELDTIFTTTIVLHIYLCIIVFLLSETVGLWFVANKLTIPPKSYNTALWVYHISIITTVFSIIKIPYDALVIAHEDMKAFAYVSIIETFIKLGIAIIISYTPFNRLIFYALLLFIVQFIITIIFFFYCRTKYPESRAKLHLDKKLTKEIAEYSSWCVLGQVAVAGYTQGINILLNMFFGTVVNAARGIAVQVQGAVYQLCNNFQMALNPQITKSYASGNIHYLHSLVNYSSKLSFYLMLLLITPIILNCKYILNLWLVSPPEYTVQFTKITLIISTLSTLKNPILAAIHATGNIKKVQIVEGLCLLTIVPISYFFLKTTNTQPLLVFVIYLIIEVLTQMIRIKMILPKIGMDIGDYVYNSIYPIIKVSIFIILPLLIIDVQDNFLFLILSSFIYTLFNSIIIFYLGLTQKERSIIKEKSQTLINKYFKHL